MRPGRLRGIAGEGLAGGGSGGDGPPEQRPEDPDR